MGEETEEVFNSDTLAEELKADGLELPDDVSAEENPESTEEVKKEEEKVDENVIKITPKEGDEVTIEKGKELPDGVTAEMLPDTVMLDDKGVIVDKPPEPSGWKHGDKEYKPEELLKYIDDAKNARELKASGTNATKEAAKVERSMAGVFKLAEKLKADPDLLETLKDEVDDDTAEMLTELAGLNKSELKDPLEDELTAREKGIAEKEYIFKYVDIKSKLKDDNKLDDAEMEELDKFCDEYYRSMDTDETLPHKWPDELYKQSPMYEQKLKDVAKAEGIAEAERKQKLKEDAEKLKKKNPPSKSAGSSGGGGEFETVEDLKKDMAATIPQE